MRLRNANQLFDPMDPSPTVDKDLTDVVQDYIVSSAEELSAPSGMLLRIYLDEWPDSDPTDVVSHAVHNHFTRQAALSRAEFRRLMRLGRTTLLIGVVFLAACLVVTNVFLLSETGAWAGMLRESLTIAGWVAMWRPMQIYLYDWWPLRRKWRVYAALSEMPVEVVQRPAG